MERSLCQHLFLEMFLSLSKRVAATYRNEGDQEEDRIVFLAWDRVLPYARRVQE